jgi:hypothetical protein
VPTDAQISMQKQKKYEKIKKNNPSKSPYFPKSGTE